MESNRNSCYLPEELVDEILLRLAVKALLVCKCVCKEWCALIESPSFVTRHFSHESNQDSLFFQTNDENQYTYSMYEDDESQKSNYLPQMPKARHLVGPEHGVFCVVSTFNHIGLVNPAMREFKALPPLPLHNPFDVYNPLHDHFGFYSPVIGLGLDPCSGDFKVVAFKQTRHQSYAFVYNSTSDSWKSIEVVKKALDLTLFGEHVSDNQILNGVNHWIVRFTCRDDCFILAFDMRSEKFREIPIPDAIRRSEERDLQLTAYGDHSLAVVSFEIEKSFDLWVMGRDGLWSKNFSLSIDPSKLLYVWPLFVWKKKKLFFETTNSLIVCDIFTQKLTIVIADSYPNMCRHFIYKESLVSVKGERVRLSQINGRNYH